MSTTTAKHTAAGDELHAGAEKYAETHNCSYREGMIATLAADKQLAEAYAMSSSRVSPKPLRPRQAAPAPVPVEGTPAGIEVDRRAQALIAEHPHLDYHEAMGAVLHEDPALKARYAGVQR